MPTIKVNGVNLVYKESGSGPETIVFSHGLLMDHTMFEPQRALLRETIPRDRLRSPRAGPVWNIGRGYDMSTIADDATMLIRALRPLPAISRGSPWEALPACAWRRTILS